VQTAIQVTRFLPGAQTVGGPMDVASITKHEGSQLRRPPHKEAADGW
jgi:hypothetical protein